jgi:cobalt transporter subunit CbtB
VEGDKEFVMTIQANQAARRNPAAASSTAVSRLLQIALAGLLGVFIIGGVGFSHVAAVHNAAHDARHSLAFPCH